MKTKLYKICGVALALVLVFSLAGAFIPVNRAEGQAYTPNQFNVLDTPDPAPPFKIVTGSDVTDIAVAGDGRTIYAVDINAAGGVDGWMSPNGGGIWQPIPTLSTATNFTAGTAKLVAVAPDDPNAVAVVAWGAASDGVWYSNTAGATWAYMGETGVPAEIIMDIAVSPARTGTIMGRDIVVATSNTAAGAFGDIYLIPGAVWTPAAVPAGLVALDFTSLALAPNWSGDRVVIAVGSDDGTIEGADANDASAGASPGDTYLVLLNIAPLDLSPPGAPTIVNPYPVKIEAGLYDSAPEMGVANWGILSSSVSLPMDFDSTTVVGRRSYIGWTSMAVAPANFADDVWRVDNSTVRKLEIAPNVGIYSVSFSGTIASGTLFAGETVGAAATAPGLVWYASDPQVAIPTWTYSFKAPTGSLGAAGNANVVVAAAPDFTSSMTVYAGTGSTVGDDSAFSVSRNGGVSFNQTGLIDMAFPIVLTDAMPTPDNSVVLLATEDGAGSHSLWKSTAKPTGSTWERIRFKPTGVPNAFTTVPSIIRLSPEYATDSTIYWCDSGAGSSGVIERSVDGGDVFATRTAPVAITDLAVENKDIVYMGQANQVRRSVNGGWFFDLPIDAQVAGVYSLAMCPTYPQMPVAGNLLVGGTGNCSLSTNSAASFRPLSASVGAGTNFQVLADNDYANNNIVYSGSRTASQGIWRYQVGTSTAWEQIRGIGANADMTGLAMVEGVLYGSWWDAVAAPAAVGGDAFTIVEPAGVSNGTIIVSVGSVTVTVGGPGPATIALTPITPASGPVAWTAAAPGDFLTITATTAGTVGVWTRAVGAATATITTDADGDAAVVAAGGNFSLPDAAAMGAAVAAAGVERTLYATVPVVAEVFFETMDVPAPAVWAANTVPTALRGASGSTITLWTINTGANALLAYDDTMALAKPTLTVPDEVPIDPVSGRNAQFTISWPAVSNAIQYEVEIHTDPSCTQLVIESQSTGLPAGWYQPPNTGAPTWVVPAGSLVAGMDYFTRIRCRNQMPGDGIRSPWSSVYRFAAAGGERVQVSYLGPQPLGPSPGSIDVPIDGPGFTWSPYAQATRYEFQLAKDAGFTDIVASTKTSATGYKYDGKLSNAATYFWRVRGIEPTTTDWSPVASFTTEKAPPPPPAPAPTPPPPPPPPPPVVTPTIIWAIIGIGAILVIAVIVLIVRTRAAR